MAAPRSLRQDGKVFQRLIADAQRREYPTILVGFFESARYPPERRIFVPPPKGGRGSRPVRKIIKVKRPPNVAYVAAINEFGYPAGKIPERPFFRNAINDWENNPQSPVQQQIRRSLDTVTLDVGRQQANVIGIVAEGQLKKSITELDAPANSPTTIQLKGSSKPLIDTGLLKLSTSHRVIHGGENVV